MNFLAKHFFDYQSFVNLPHKAVQLHKTPPSQSGVDPSAAWGPKSLHTAGKNQPTPAARANRNNVEVKPGAHRHGRPSKLEYREWGERKGELKPEKINPHKEIWMVQFDGVKHLHDEDEEKSCILEYVAKPAQKDELECQILVILTFAKTGFITVTVKKIKGVDQHKHRRVKVQLFDAGTLLEAKESGKRPENIPAAPRRTPSPVVGNHVNAIAHHPVGNHVGHVQHHNQVQAHPPQQEPQHVEAHVEEVVYGQAQPRHPPIVPNNHRAPLEEVVQRPPSVRRHSTRRQYSRDFEEEIDISESFLMHLPLQKLYTSYIIIQIFTTDPELEDENQELVGTCTIGFVSSSRAAFHWRQMIRKYEHPVCVWHRLQKPLKKHSLSL